MSIWKRGETWYADITVPGSSRFRGSLGTSSKEEAERLHDELKVSLRKRKAAGRTWYEAVALWLQQQDRSEPERRIILAYDPGDVPLSEITSDSFSIDHHKQATYSRYVAVFRAILNLAVTKGWLDKAPVFIARKPGPFRVRWITYAEWGRLYLELPAHLKGPALFAVSTGLRQSNVLDLEWRRVNLERRIVWFDADEMKNKFPHGIALSDNAVTALQSVAGQHDRWCFTYKGNRMEKVKRAWQKALGRAKIENFTWHDLRHTWASWHVQNGTRLEVLQKLGGWEDYAMVLKYAHLAPEHLAEFVNNAAPKTQICTQ